MNRDEIIEKAKACRAAEFKAFLNKYADAGFGNNEGPKGWVFSDYGIKHLQQAAEESTVERELKLRLIEDYIGLAPATDTAVEEKLAAQQQEINELRSLVLIFAETVLKNEKKNTPKTQNRTGQKRPRRRQTTNSPV